MLAQVRWRAAASSCGRDAAAGRALTDGMERQLCGWGWRGAVGCGRGCSRVRACRVVLVLGGGGRAPGVAAGGSLRGRWSSCSAGMLHPAAEQG